jgi:uncharacterized protein (DUF58 family)
VLSRKSGVLLGFAVLALVAAVVTRVPSLAIASIPIVLYVIVSALYLTQAKPSLTITRQLDRSTIYEEESVRVTVNVVNKGPPIAFADISDELPPELELTAGSNHHVVSLERAGKFSFSYAARPIVYGEYNIGPSTITIGDLQGTSVERETFESQSSLRVIPKITYIPKIRIRPKRTKNWPGEILAKKPGSGMEFYNLRDYSPGDAVKMINWKASSKNDDRLYTNQLTSELGGDTVIALDARTVSEIGRPPDSSLTHSIRATAIVAHRLLRDRNRVGMVVLGSSLEKVFPGFGKRQLDRVLVALSMTEPADIWDIQALGQYLSLFFSIMVQIIVISPLVDDRSFESILDVASRGYRVLVISPSPIEIEKKTKSKSDATYSSLAERLLRVKRKNRMDKLRGVAVVVDWNTDDSLSSALQEATYLWNKSAAR